MCVRLDRYYINLALKLGLKTVKEYAEFIIDLKNFYKGWEK